MDSNKLRQLQWMAFFSLIFCVCILWYNQFHKVVGTDSTDIFKNMMGILEGFLFGSSIGSKLKDIKNP